MVELLSAEENLRRDASLLGVAQPATRVAVLSDVSLSLGVGRRPDTPAAVRALRQGIAVLQRSTGGSAVLTGPGDLAWSVVLPRTDPRVGRDYVRAYDRFGAPLVGFVRMFGLEATWKIGPSTAPEICLLSGRGQVLSVEGRIIGGAAQHRSVTALLHHGFLARRIDRGLLGRVFDVPPESLESLGSLEEVGVGAGSETLASRLEALLQSAFGRSPKDESISP
jgi:lipoate-protein ligase A